MEIGDMGQIAYGDSCPMPLTGQQATVTTVPNGAYAPNLYLTGKDSGTFMIMGGSGITGMVGAFRVEGSKHLETRTAPGADIEWTRSSSQAPMRSAAAGQVLPGQIEWPMGDVPGFAQRALSRVGRTVVPAAIVLHRLGLLIVILGLRRVILRRRKRCGCRNEACRCQNE